MKRTEDQTRKLFDDWAADYDTDLAANEPGPLRGYHRSLQAVEGAFTVDEGFRLLDVGIGSGAVAARFASQGAKIVGVDPSERMLSQCREKYPEFELHTGTFTELPEPDTAFDGVVSGFAFHETPLGKREAACQAISQVLKPDSRLCLLDIMFASPAAVAEARELIGGAWDDSEDYALVSDLDGLIRNSGFSTIRWSQTGPFHWMVTARKLESSG